MLLERPPAQYDRALPNSLSHARRFCHLRPEQRQRQGRRGQRSYTGKFIKIVFHEKETKEVKAHWEFAFTLATLANMYFAIIILGLFFLYFITSVHCSQLPCSWWFWRSCKFVPSPRLFQRTSLADWIKIHTGSPLTHFNFDDLFKITFIFQIISVDWCQFNCIWNGLYWVIELKFKNEICTLKTTI